MKERKTWINQEDQTIKTLIAQMGDKPKWTLIAQKVNQLPHAYDTNERKPKQCRQRWHNKLNPQINGQEWSQYQVNKLYNLHNEHGNKWSIIAGKMQGRTDNCIKNKFYSTLRKGMRKINKYIVNLKRRLAVNKSICIKQFKPIVLTKLIAVADGNYQVKLQVKDGSKAKAQNLSQSIKLALVEVAKNQDDYLGHVINGKSGKQYILQEELIQNIQQFCRNCKRKKGKSKGDQQYNQQDPQDPMQQQSSKSQMQPQKKICTSKKKETYQPQTYQIKYQQPFCLYNSIDRFIDQRNEDDNFLLKESQNYPEEKDNIKRQKMGSQTMTSTSPFPSQKSIPVFWNSKGNSISIPNANQNSLININVFQPKQNVQKSGERKRISTRPTQITQAFQTQEYDHVPQHIISNMKSQQKSINFFQNIPRVDFIKTDLGCNGGMFKADQIFHYGNIRNHSTFPQNTKQNKMVSSNQNIFGLSDRSRELSFLNSSSPFQLQQDNLIINNSSSYSSGSNRLNMSIPMDSGHKSKDGRQLYSSNQKIQIKLTQSQNFQLVDQYLRRRSDVPQIKRQNKL